MKAKEFQKMTAKVVLETDVIFDYMNQDEAGMNSFPPEQLEMQFDEHDNSDSVFCLDRDDSWDKVNFSMTERDIQEQNSYYNAVKPPIKALCSALDKEYETLRIWHERLTNNNSKKGPRTLVDRLQIKVASERGEPITTEVMLDVRAKVNQFIDEINSLIHQINSTVEVKNISSVILCAEHELEGRADAVLYKTRGAAEFVNAYYNTGKAIRKKLLRLRVGSEVREITEATSPTHKVEYSARPHVIIGNLVPESITKHIYILKGRYAANDDARDASMAFNHEVLLSKKQRKNNHLLQRLASLSHSDSVEVIVYPVQPYVCITGVRSKQLALVDIK